MHRLPIARLLTLALSLWALSACGQAPVIAPQETVTLTIAGSTAMTPVLQALSTQFSHQHPQVLFSLRGGGSLLGEMRAADGQIDLAASTILPNAPSSAPAPDAGSSLVRIPIGIDGVAVIVHPLNQVKVLTLLQLRDIYSGHLLSWADVGWPVQNGGGDLLLVSREDGSGTRSFFEEQVMADERVALTAVVMPTSRDVVDYVSEHPQAIGYVSAAYVQDQMGEDSPADAQEVDGQETPTVQADGAPPQQVSSPDTGSVKVVPVEGVLPLIENLRQQRYYLSQPIFLISPAEPVGWVRQFVDFVLSPSGQEIVARFHAPIR